MKNVSVNVEKVDVEDIIKNFKVTNVDVFNSYLKEVWMVKEMNIINRILRREVMTKLKESTN